MPIKTYYLAPDGNLQQDLTEEQVTAAYRAKQGLLWVDITGVSAEEGEYMSRCFQFHRLAIDDCISPDIHSPKIDEFEGYLFVIVHGVNHAIDSEIVETAELALFLGANFIVTAHTYTLFSVNAIQSMVEEDNRLMRRGSDFLGYSLIDALVDNVIPTIDSMSDVAEQIEEEVIRRPHSATLDGIMKLKRSTLRVHRVMAPQREVLNRLSRGEYAIIKNEFQIYYRDVYDHVVRIEDLNQSIQDRADNALATYLSSVANRQNETMRVLSVVATIFMPLTLLAGIYGMNFEYMPELSWRWGYFAVLGVIGVVMLFVIWRFWASGWFAWGKRRVAWVKPFMVETRRLRGYLSSNTKKHEKKDGSSVNDTGKTGGSN
jgi:magnesium transporter